MFATATASSAPAASETSRAPSRTPAASGLRAPVVVDKVQHSVGLLIGLVAGFGSCSSVEQIRASLEGLGRSDARLVLEELAENHDFVRREVAVLSPDLLSVLESKCAA